MSTKEDERHWERGWERGGEEEEEGAFFRRESRRGLLERGLNKQRDY